MKKENQSWAIILFSIGVFMAALDNGIISAALTTINNQFNVNPSHGAWGVTLYTLGLAMSVPIVGKLSDRYGRKKLFIIEVALFGLGSLLVALSQSFWMFLVARLIQALGGGGIFIIGSSHILSTVEKEKQGKALGLLGGMNGIAAVLGPNIGSFLLDWTGNWHWLFLINLPIALFLVVVGTLKIEETRDDKKAPLDFLGTGILALSILALMYGLTNLDGVNLIEGMKKLDFYGYVLAGLVLFIGLIGYERYLEKKGGDPVLPFSLLRQSSYITTLFIGLCSGMLIAAIIFIPAFVEQYLGVSASKSGYWMTPLALASGIGAGLGGALVDKQGPVKTVIISGIVSFIGFALFPMWVEEIWQFLIASIIAGIGFGMLLGAPVNVLATENSEQNKGPALGTLSLSRQIGLTLAPTIYAGFLTRNFAETGNVIMENLQKSGYNFSLMPSSGAEDMSKLTQEQLTNMLTKVPDPKFQQIVQDSLHTVSGNAFSGLYLAATIISACIILLGIIIIPLRKNQDAKKELGI